jgi:TolA-binding protein
MSDKKKKGNDDVTKTEIVEGKVNSFLGTYRNLLFIIGAAIIVVVFALIIINTVHTKNLEKAFDKIDQLENTYTQIQAMDKTANDYKTKYDGLKNDLTALSKGKTYPALKAQYLLATIAYEDKDYETAEKGFYAIYDASKDTYLGSLSLTNAAVVAEDKGDADTALEYYTKVWDEYGTAAAESPKALFNQGRLEQQKGDMKLAKATFQQLVDQFPSSEYAKLAKSIVIVL